MQINVYLGKISDKFNKHKLYNLSFTWRTWRKYKVDVFWTNVDSANKFVMFIYIYTKMKLDVSSQKRNLKVNVGMDGNQIYCKSKYNYKKAKNDEKNSDIRDWISWKKSMNKRKWKDLI
jgi:hypothetical protein